MITSRDERQIRPIASDCFFSKLKTAPEKQRNAEMPARGVRSKKQTPSPTRFLWSSPTAGSHSQLLKGRGWRDMMYFCLHSSHVSWFMVESHFSIQLLCIRPTDPEHLQGEISLSPLLSPSWQILQKRTEEFLLQFCPEVELLPDIHERKLTWRQ